MDPIPRGLPLEQLMAKLNNEGLLVDGVFSGIDKVTVFENGQQPQTVNVKPVVVYEAGKDPVTMLNPVS